MCCFLSVFQLGKVESRGASADIERGKRGLRVPSVPWSWPIVCHGSLGSLQTWVLLVCRAAQSPEFGHLKPIQQWHRKVNSPPLPKTFLFLVVQFEPHVSFFYHIMVSSAGECRNMILSPSDPFCLKVYKDCHSF